MNEGVLKALESNSLDMLKQVITRNNVNCVISGLTASEHAADKNALLCLQWLLEDMGANLGGSLIFAAVNSNIECVKYLLYCGANPNSTLYDAMSGSNVPSLSKYYNISLLRYVIARACKNGNDLDFELIARLLIEAGGLVNDSEMFGDEYDLLITIKSNMRTKQMRCKAVMPALFFCIRKFGAPRDLVRHLLKNYVAPTWKDQRWL